jgi:hypothetical protein
MELRKHWLLPDESKLSYTRPNWLLILLNQLEGDLKAKVLFLLWRAWHLRNDMVHGQGTGSVMGSVQFLVNYWDTWRGAHLGNPVQASVKGKEIMEGSIGREGHANELMSDEPAKKIIWEPPPEGWAKLNTDAGFYDDTGNGDTGVVIRDHRGRVLSAWSFISHCGSPEIAEAEACLQGIWLAAEWVRHAADI